MSQLSRELAEQREAQAQPQTTVYDVIKQTLQSDNWQAEFKRLVGDAVGAERFVRVALTELRKNPKLVSANRASLYGVLMQSAALGLEPGPIGHVYLVPYGEEVQLIVGYKGLIALAAREGIYVDAQAVHEGDRFSYSYGLNPKLLHQPSDDPGELTHVWAVARAGEARWMRVLTRTQVEEYRGRSRAAQKKGGPWDTDYEPMAVKTVIRRLFAVVPVQAGSRFAEALAVDEDATVEPPPLGLPLDVETSTVEEEPKEQAEQPRRRRGRKEADSPPPPPGQPETVPEPEVVDVVIDVNVDEAVRRLTKEEPPETDLEQIGPTIEAAIAEIEEAELDGSEQPGESPLTVEDVPRPRSAAPNGNGSPGRQAGAVAVNLSVADVREMDEADAWSTLGALLSEESGQPGMSVGDLRNRIRVLFALCSHVGLPRWSEGSLGTVIALSYPKSPSLNALAKVELYDFAERAWQAARQSVEATRGDE
jgi:recombination protein RecT